MAGSFQGIQFLRKSHLQRFRNLIFVDRCSRTAPPTIHHANYYGHASLLIVHAQVTADFYFADLILVDCCSTVKIAKIGSLKNFHLYSMFLYNIYLLISTIQTTDQRQLKQRTCVCMGCNWHSYPTGNDCCSI